MSWPLSRSPFALGVREVGTSGKISTQPRNGPPQFRRKSTARTRFFTGRVPGVTGTDLALLITHHDSTCAEGTLSFTDEDPIDDSAATYFYTTRPTWVLDVGNSTPGDRRWIVDIAIQINPS